MIFLFLFVPAISALITPRPILLSNNLTIAGEPSTNSTTIPTGPNYLACRTNLDGVKLGNSCINAWAKIPRTTSENVYVSRREAPPAASDIVVPIRYLSEDGLCAIDLRARERDTIPDPGDITRSIDISDAAGKIIEVCVERSGRGGLLSGFSARNALQVNVVDYKFKASCVHFPRTIALLEPCAQSLEDMPASRRAFSFVGPDDPHPGKYARLPKLFRHDRQSRGSCEVAVSRDPASGATQETWYNIWAAGIDILTRCVEGGMSGSVNGLGDNQQIHIEVGDTRSADA